MVDMASISRQVRLVPAANRGCRPDHLLHPVQLTEPSILVYCTQATAPQPYNSSVLDSYDEATKAETNRRNFYIVVMPSPAEDPLSTLVFGYLEQLVHDSSSSSMPMELLPEDAHTRRHHEITHLQPLVFDDQLAQLRALASESTTSLLST